MRWLGYTVPALLVVVTLCQQWMVKNWHLTPWKGAGFGMFSTIDQPGHRILRASVVVDGTPLPLEVDSLLTETSPQRPALGSARAMPSPGALERAARALAEVSWALEEDSTTGQMWLRPADTEESALSVRKDEVRLEVRTLLFDASGLEVRTLPLASWEADVAP